MNLTPITVEELINRSNLRWAPIPGFENYAVSDSGRVWSLDFDCSVHLYNARSGGMYIKLLKDERTTMPTLHSLVANAFIPNDSPIRNTYIKHLNGNKKDNRVENLEWVHKSELFDRLEAKMSLKQHVTLTEQEVLEIRALHAAGIDYGTISREFHVSRATVKNIALRETWFNV